MTEKILIPLMSLSDQDTDHCRQLVRQHDLDRYLTAILADRSHQGCLFALYAFNQQICEIADQVSEPAMGEIRLQWWRDEIDNIFGGGSENHPISRVLVACIKTHDLPKHLFKQLIDAHQFDLYREPMGSVTKLTTYLYATTGNVFELASRILVGDDALELKQQINDAAISYGLAVLVGKLAEQVRNRQCFVPLDLLASHGLSEKNILAGEHSKALELVLIELSHLSNKHTMNLRDEQNKFSKAVLPAFFPVLLSQQYFDHVAKFNRKPLKSTVEISQLAKQWKLLKASLFEKL